MNTSRLGVEFTGVDKEMAKQMDIRRETEDGRLGLMVNRIYPGSPAEKLGLKEGDILLKLKVPDGPWPIDLRQSFDHNDTPDWEDIDIPEQFESMGFSRPRRRPWPSRGNFFTQMLGISGDGSSARLIWLNAGEIKHGEFTVEHSPPDSLSAKKHKDKDLGLTVKNVTDEVRAALRLSPEDNAIYISKVEEGMPTALARIKMFELIRAVDGSDIANVDDFAAAIQKARDENKTSVRITVEWMGKTRLADLKFDAAAKPGGGFLKKFLPGADQ